MAVENNLPLAFRILATFYVVAAIIGLITGNFPSAIEIPELPEGTTDLGAFLNGVISLINAILTLLTAPIGVLLMIQTGITAIDVTLIGLSSIALIFSYFVIIASIKNLINPLH